ncbi:MAG: SGNH/GDSL hydrolase family protein [Synoicihabitans sp.]
MSTPPYPRALVFLFVGLLFSSAVIGEPEVKKDPAADVQWHDVTTWDIEGRAWVDWERQRWFDRLPAQAEGSVTDRVWSLSRSPTGMVVRFTSDATTLWVDFSLRDASLNGVNMTPIGASGLDLYARDDSGKWRWVEAVGPRKQTHRGKIVEGLAPGSREYALYLPLRNGIETLEIGVPPGSHFTPLAPREIPPIVFYGTSINHGASASRPGMVHTAILGRRFDRPVVNLGFSGNGRMDAAVGELMVHIDAAIYVIDCLPNMNAAMVREKCVPLVKQLRAAQPDIPIVLVEDRRNTNSWILPDRNAHHSANHAALRECFDQLLAEGYDKLFYIPGDMLLGLDGEGTTDGSHPSDLGFMRQADVFTPIIRQALIGR